MVHPHRPGVRSHAARSARPEHAFTKLMVMGGVCVLSYAGLSHGAHGPAPELDATILPSMNLVQASLNPASVDPVVTGSFDHLFASASFTGPNRAEKTDRVRSEVDVVAIARSFEAARIQIAALRAGDDPAAMGQSGVAMAAAAGRDEGPRMSVASVDAATAAALDAIAGIAPTSLPISAMTSGPLPVVASEQLAYARASAPVTGAYSTGPAVAASEKELWCLATAIYFEARGEAYRGQVAVAQVVLNRVKDHRYPNTICGVVYQNQHRRNSCQFSFACDGIPETITDRQSWAQAEDIAKRYTTGELYLTEVGDATHYHATYVRPAWAPRMQKVTQIGLHIFYKFKSGWMFG